MGDELLERHLLEPWAHSRHLGGYWLPVEADNGDLSLRLSRDEHGLQLFLTPEEHYAREREREAEGRRVAEQALAAREKEAERRIADSKPNSAAGPSALSNAARVARSRRGVRN